MVSPVLSTLPDQPLSNLQLHLLKMYAIGISDDDLIAIQRMIARYFAEKASREAQEVWNIQKYSAEELLAEHMRTPYRQNNKVDEGRS